MTEAEAIGGQRDRSGPSSDSITVLVVDDHGVFAEALAMAIDAEPDLECVGTALSIAEALPLVERHRPDTVLMDAYLPGVDGVEGTRRIRRLHPDTVVLILTGRADARMLADAIAAGAAGFLQKERSFQDIAEAIRHPADIDISAAAPVFGDLVEQIRAHDPRSSRLRGMDLTNREGQVLGLLAQGTGLNTIASALGISVHTCRGHVKNLLVKFGVHSQLELVVTAAREGLLPDHPLETPEVP